LVHPSAVPNTSFVVPYFQPREQVFAVKPNIHTFTLLAIQTNYYTSLKICKPISKMIYISTEYGKTLSKSINCCMIRGTENWKILTNKEIYAMVKNPLYHRQ
jgi:hypothetical protein